MKRLLVACALAAACSGALFGAVGASASDGVPRARLKGFLCQRALEPAQRMVSVEAVMRPLKGTQRLQLKFELLSKVPGSTTVGFVHGGDLGIWISPPRQQITLGTRPGDVWSLNHPVADLFLAPAYYHFRVTFRWLGAHQRVLGTVVRESPRCFQPELRPDLVAVSLVAIPITGKPTKDSYAATIADDGLTGAGPFTVEFTDGAIVKDDRVHHINAKSAQTLHFVGPVCNASSPPTMTVDPAQQVDDYNRTNNGPIAAVCPAVAPAG
jgi:hypothetical protein